MIRRTLLTILSVALLTSLAVTEADAGRRFKHRQWRGFENYYAGPEYIPAPEYYGFFVTPHEDAPDEADQAYGDTFNDTYYEPTIEPRVAKPATAKKKPATVASKPAGKLPVTAEKTTLLSCDKATDIVSGFGFSSVKASDCQGQVYAFNATRDGKSFAIKLNASNGELTEVRKIQ